MMLDCINSTSNESFATAEVIVFYSAYAIVGVAIVFGNSLVIAAILKFPVLQTPTNVFILNMSIADLIVGLFHVPTFVVYHIYAALTGTDNFSFNSLGGIPLGISLDASFGFIIVITVDRYYAVFHPLKRLSHFTKSKARKLSAVVWLIALTDIVLPILRVCRSIDHTVLFVLQLLNWVGVSVLTMVVITVLYVKIYLKINQRHKELSAKQTVLTSGSVSGKRNQDINIKATKTTLLVVVTFYLCVLPTCVELLTSNIISREQCTRVKLIYRCIGVFLVTLNSALNPVIYAARNKQFRATFCSLLRIKTKRPTAVTNSVS